jgi:hypothetical protein
MFILINTVEMDVMVGEDILPTRVEIFRKVDKSNTYRWRVWQVECYRIIPALGVAESEGQDMADELIMTERSWRISGLESELNARNDQDAFDACLDAIKADILNQGLSLL